MTVKRLKEIHMNISGNKMHGICFDNKIDGYSFKNIKNLIEINYNLFFDENEEKIEKIKRSETFLMIIDSIHRKREKTFL